MTNPNLQSRIQAAIEEDTGKLSRWIAAQIDPDYAQSEEWKNTSDRFYLGVMLVFPTHILVWTLMGSSMYFQLREREQDRTDPNLD